MNSTVGRIESVTNTFTLVTDEVDTLKAVLVRIFVCMPPELFFLKKKKIGVGGGSGGGSGWLSMHTIGLYKRELVAVVLFKNNDYCVYYYYRAEVLPINLVPFAAMFVCLSDACSDVRQNFHPNTSRHTNVYTDF